jgi:hypothetical protein
MAGKRTSTRRQDMSGKLQVEIRFTDVNDALDALELIAVAVEEGETSGRLHQEGGTAQWEILTA